MQPADIPAWAWLLGGALAGWLTALPAAVWYSYRLRRERDLHRAEARRESQQADKLEIELTRVREELDASRTRAAVLEEKFQQENRRVEESRALLEQAEKRLADTFKGLSKDVLDQNSGQFLQLAEQAFKRLQSQAGHEWEKKHQAVESLVKPIGESLAQVQAAVGEVEKARIDAYAALKQQMDALLETHLPRLHKETETLVRALRQPAARGRWGEVQLRRVVEMAGMVSHCDFEEQVSRDRGNGRLRPDLIVHLPGRRSVVVDAKVPLEAYLQAVEAEDDEERQSRLTEHAAQLKRHIQQLSMKSYFEQFERAPEFVVLFMPGEAFFSAALHADPGLIEYGVENKVIPASPTTLIALLKAVAYGWQQETMAQSAEEIVQLGKALYERIVKVSEHWVKTGDQLEKTVRSYNQATRSLESRLLPTARKFQSLRRSPEHPALAPLESVDQTVHPLRLPDRSD
ncbi:MAG: DNA recombination protein RmuC [Methylohalobius sp. ZOD2]